MNWIRRHMVGRYGRLDQLNIFLFVLMFVIAIVRIVLNIFFRFSMLGLFNPMQSAAASSVYSVLFGLQTAAIVIIFLRFLSRNIERRTRENQMFLNRWYNLKDWNKFRKKKNEAKKEGKVLFKCPVCRKIIRVPAGKGRIEITCPNCKNKFVKKT